MYPNLNKLKRLENNIKIEQMNREILNSEEGVKKADKFFEELNEYLINEVNEINKEGVITLSQPVINYYSKDINVQCKSKSIFLLITRYGCAKNSALDEKYKFSIRIKGDQEDEYHYHVFPKYEKHYTIELTKDKIHFKSDKKIVNTPEQILKEYLNHLIGEISNIIECHSPSTNACK